MIVGMQNSELLDSTGLGDLVGGLKKVRAHDGSLDLVCTQERLLKIFRITGLAKDAEDLPHHRPRQCVRDPRLRRPGPRRLSRTARPSSPLRTCPEGFCHARIRDPGVVWVTPPR